MKEPRAATLNVQYVTHPGETHQITYYTWGKEDAPPVICVHGMARNGRDFDFLADALCDRYRVISLDMPGRGKSQWLSHPEEYNPGCYIPNLIFFMDSLKLGPVRWVGTSMGGILGMMMAATQPQRIVSLVQNDVGAKIPGRALARLAGYVGVKVQFSSRTEAEAKLRDIYTPFGITREEIWQHLFAHSFEDMPGGTVRMAYDPAIGAALNQDPAQPDVDLSAIWEQVKCPVLLIRGGISDILPADVAEQMQSGHPDMAMHVVPNVGHAPLLAEEREITRIHRWLESPAA